MTGPNASPDRWPRMWDLFHAALERSVGERAAFLDDACGDDAVLRQQVGDLLVAHGSDGILDESLVPADSPPRIFAAGDRLISRFRIVRPLGAGGMGAVYEAVDEELGR